MISVASIAKFLEEFSPPRLAADWDNVGLLIGDSSHEVKRVMTCLTVTPESVAEAVKEKADLIVTHHPLLFRPVNKLTNESIEGRMLLDLIGAGIAVFSSHTAFDSAAAGINQQLAEGLSLKDVRPLEADAEDCGIGTGRTGTPATGATLGEMAERAKNFLGLAGLHVVGDLKKPIKSVAIAGGSAGELLDSAIRAGCDCFVTGEARFHTCLEAQAHGIALVLAGHFASERFAMERLAEVLAKQFPSATVWASRSERDPLEWV